MEKAKWNIDKEAESTKRLELAIRTSVARLTITFMLAIILRFLQAINPVYNPPKIPTIQKDASVLNSAVSKGEGEETRKRAKFPIETPVMQMGKNTQVITRIICENDASKYSQNRDNMIEEIIRTTSGPEKR